MHYTLVRCEHSDSLSQVLGILRAEHGSAPTDLRRKNLYIINIYERCEH